MGVWVRLRLLPTLGGGGGGDDIAARVYGGASGGETERAVVVRGRRGSRAGGFRMIGSTLPGAKFAPDSPYQVRGKMQPEELRKTEGRSPF
jgi:hypothetical protein